MATASKFVAVLFTVTVTLASARGDDKPSPAAKPVGDKEVRQAITRGLGYLEKEGLAWWKQRKCNGCHHGSFLLWSHHEAMARGIDVDRQKLDAWSKQALELYRKDSKDHLAKKNGCVESAHLLLGLAAAPGQSRDAEALKSLKDFAEVLVGGQQADGFWKYEGQPLKRPDAENNETTTLWHTLALGYWEKADPALSQGKERALAWLKKTPIGPSNEALVARMLVEHRFGDLAAAKKLGVQIKGQQNSDGGWSWTKERPSEAFATGQTLAALAQLGLAGGDGALERGKVYLVATQLADGSWKSPTRKPAAKDNPIAIYWGTAWATIGLARTLPEKQ